MVMTNLAPETAATTIDYGLFQHEGTGDIWAIKLRGETVLGARRFPQKDQPFVEDLPFLVYDVGTAREYVSEMRNRFAIWPFTRTRAKNSAPSADI